jgi:endonuclease-3
MVMSNKTVKIISILEKGIKVNWFLVRGEPFKVLITTLLSQRTRDENTDKASKKLFSRFRTPKQMVNANLRDIEKLIRPSGFYNVKARRIKEISRILIRENNGKVPETIEGMMKLPGIGRKTANCVMVYAYGKPCIPVDTHVHRIPNRMGIVRTRTPEETEKELMRIVPESKQILFNELFVKFGQRICKPIGPRCYECPVETLCGYQDKNMKTKDST